jgi:glycine/D-amino acid oxidase-like deaminating enzyme
VQDRPHNAGLPTDADLVVLGSGVGGLTAALTAALEGLSAVVIEHTESIGGTSARSSGTVWVPGNRYLDAHGIARDGEDAARYLASLVGERGEPAMSRAFLDGAPSMLLDLERRAGIAFRPYMTAPDYRQDHPGAARGGRALEPLPFDGSALGADFTRLAWPIPEFMLLRGMMVTRGEAAQLLRADRSLRAFALGVRLVTRYLRDRLEYPRGTRLVLGNALVARLLKALLDRRVPVLTGVRTHRLVMDGARVAGIEAAVDGTRRTVAARRGVVLAGGGFPPAPRCVRDTCPSRLPNSRQPRRAATAARSASVWPRGRHSALRESTTRCGSQARRRYGSTAAPRSTLTSSSTAPNPG